MNSSHGEDPTDTLLLINSFALHETKLSSKVHHYLVSRAKNKLTSLPHLGQLEFSILSFTKGGPQQFESLLKLGT